MEDVFIGLLPLACSVTFLICHLPRDGPATVSKALLYQVAIWEMPYRHAHSQSDGGNSTTEVPSTKYVKLTTKINHQAAPDSDFPSILLVMGYLSCPA